VEDRGKVAAIELLRSDPMKRSTVDLVVTGDETAAVAAAVDAVRRGQRVLVVLRAAGPRIVPRLRRLCQAAKHQLTVMTNAEVVCVDGVHGAEAVVMRYNRTRRLCAVNTSAFRSYDDATQPPRARVGDSPLEIRKADPQREDIASDRGD
jgi:thioredoxin reductase